MSNSAVGVVVSIQVKPGRGAEQEAFFAQLAPLVRAEDGCLQYELHPVIGDPDRYVILEWWESEAALAAHGSAPHMATVPESNAVFRAAPAVLTRIAPAL
jgi:quinol monooxygenase YgiN